MRPSAPRPSIRPVTASFRPAPTTHARLPDHPAAKNKARRSHPAELGHTPEGYPFIHESRFNVQKSQVALSLAHELSGLGSTRVVRFHASAGRRINEPDDMATGPQDGQIL